MICKSCGCSESRPCFDEDADGPCFWAEPDLCSVCAPVAGLEYDGTDPSAAVVSFPTPPSGRFPTFRPRQVA
jgi:hypothetical protein